jgi:hypothetical protein
VLRVGSNGTFSGLAVLLPTMLTIWILAWATVSSGITSQIHQPGLVELILYVQGPGGPDKDRLTAIFVDGTPARRWEF